ncbi:hypothetical protein DAEQUDRAFT_721207 [Daedalea quercina L-15889]|uniref:HPP transmembrane region domain-containing protein n=1 Tax=Daedalea quercina L-15889 TaxID=1314783 RepID=A0A165TPJ1_9APHY|nr:hypothetical protein DAEQUDRAFT_721207 [Daedalea quercina L-15889]
MNLTSLVTYPAWLTRWVGHRTAPPPVRSRYIVWLWSFIGAFCGLSILQALFGHAQYFVHRGVPSLIASYGASAVLCYGAVEAPFSQPRALIGGHFLSALLGLCITKLFALSAHFASLRWLAASLSTAVAIVVMQATGTTHPPAGATALLPAIDADVWAMGWYYLPVVLLSSTMTLATALLINNIQRRYPVFWIAPVVPAPAKVMPAATPPEGEDRMELESRSTSCLPENVGEKVEPADIV